MKKFILSFFAILMAITSVTAQREDLKISLISKVEKEAKLLFYYSVDTVTPGRDSLNQARNAITHFKPLEITVDHLLDTVSIDSNYLDYYNSQILESYQSPGKTIFLVNNENSTETTWLGFWDEETLKTDTIKFRYEQVDNKIETVREKSTISESGFDYWLLGFWVALIISLIIRRKKILDKYEWIDPVSAITLLVSLFRIVFSYSIVILITLFVIGSVLHSINKWKKARKLKKG